jgi:Flp pilus assembly pilin Flp
MARSTSKNDIVTQGGGGGKPLWQRRFWCLDCQDSSKNPGKIFSFGRACNCLKKFLFRFIKFLFRRRNFQLRKKSSGATFVESALVVALVITAAIGGLGYLGQSIREQLGFIFDEAAQRKSQICQSTKRVMIENGIAEEDASRIANTAADAAAAAYQAALDTAGDFPELANKAAAWAAYTAAYGQMFWSYTAIEEAEQAYWGSEARQAMLP